METSTIDLLLFEDNPGDVGLFRQLIQDATLSTFRVTHVETLEEGLGQLKDNVFDIALLDLVLPDSEGLDTYERVKADCGDTPIVVLTGMDDTLLALETLKRGAQDFLVKNMMTSELLERSLHYAIERRKLAALQEEVQRARLELEAVRETRRRFLSNISHELKTPLTSIVGNLQLLERSSDLSGFDQATAQKALVGCKRLDQVMTNILEASKMESGGLVVVSKPLDPALVFTGLAERYRSLAEAKGVDLTFESRLPPSVTSDEAKLSFIIEALLDNAVKFTDSGSIKVSLAVQGGSLTLTVTDSGPGFPDTGHLFDAFQCDLHYLDVRGKGAGLGLPISKAYAEAMGGTLTITANVTGGSLVQVVVPVGGAETSIDSNAMRAAAATMADAIRASLEDAVVKADPDLFRTRLEAAAIETQAVLQFEDLMQTYRYNEILEVLTGTAHE